MSAEFTFTVLDQEAVDRVAPSGSRIRHIGEKPEDQILSLGRLKTLFGEPLYLSEDLEDQYTYFLSTVTAAGRTLCLSAYSGPTGPAIGGEQDEASCAAADALAALINSASPADYDYEGYYLDGPCRVRMGVRNGVPYMEEDELSDEEFEQILRKINNR